MVLKLIKHEFKYLGRYLLLIWAGIILMIVSQRFLTEFYDSKNTILQAVASSAAILLVFSVIAMFFITFAVIVMRFYQNMFTGEGYLTFTLPVKAWQIVFAKLFAGIVFMTVPLITTGLLIASYIRNSETWYILYSGFLGFLEQTEIPIYILVIFGITFLLAPVMQLLEFYLAMSFGQLANRNKIVFSIIAYIGIYSIKQFFGFLIWVFMMMSGVLYDVEAAPYRVMTMTSVIGLLVTLILIVVDWTLVNYLCKNKLNLE